MSGWLFGPQQPWLPLVTHLSSWAEVHRQRGLCGQQRLALSSGTWEPLESSEWKGHVRALCLLTRSFWMLGADEQGRQQEGHFANWLTAGAQAGNSTTRKWEIVSSETWSGAKSVKFDKRLQGSPEKKNEVKMNSRVSGLRSKGTGPAQRSAWGRVGAAGFQVWSAASLVGACLVWDSNQTFREKHQMGSRCLERTNSVN